MSLVREKNIGAPMDELRSITDSPGSSQDHDGAAAMRTHPTAISKGVRVKRSFFHPVP